MAEAVFGTVDLAQVVSQQAFADLVGVSQPAVSDMMSRGVIAEGQPLGAWLLAYTSHLRELAAGRGSDNELANERARLAREQADSVAMKNARERKELAPVEVLEGVLAHTARQIATVLEGIQPKLRRACPDLTSANLQIITAELARARQLCAVVNLSALDENAEDEGEDA